MENHALGDWCAFPGTAVVSTGLLISAYYTNRGPCTGPQDCVHCHHLLSIPLIVCHLFYKHAVLFSLTFCYRLSCAFSPQFSSRSPVLSRAELGWAHSCRDGDVSKETRDCGLDQRRAEPTWPTGGAVWVPASWSVLAFITAGQRPCLSFSRLPELSLSCWLNFFH